MQKKNTKLPIAFRMIQWFYPRVEKYVPQLAYSYSWKLFFSPFRFKTPSRELKVVEKAERLNATIGGKKIAFYTWGNSEGPLIFMVHGWSGRASQFFALIDNFVGMGCRVVAFDGPAHGQSSGKQTNVIEFANVLLYANKQWGKPTLAIGHSFGGVSLFFAKTKGFEADSFVFIATPTIGQDIIDGFLTRINASRKTSDNFRKRVINTFNFEFDYLTASEVVKRIEFERLLVIHDENDLEVPIRNARIMKKRSDKVHLIETQGLGHTRILRDMKVISYISNFYVKQENSNLMAS